VGRSAVLGRQGLPAQRTSPGTYAAMVTRMDRKRRPHLDQLKKLGLDENTIVLFSSDNGPTHDHAGGADSEFFESVAPCAG